MGDEAAGDPGLWVDLHGDFLYRYALMRLRDPDLAADVVQETFLEALRARESFTGRSSERTWLVGVLKHKVVDAIRKAARRRAADQALAFEAEAELARVEVAARGEFDRRGHWRVGPAPWRGDPARDAETQEFWAAFGRCLAKLPPAVADAFTLRELDDLDAAEVQEILGVNATTLWARLHRARTLLRRCLEVRWFGPNARPPRSTPEGEAESPQDSERPSPSSRSLTPSTSPPSTPSTRKEGPPRWADSHTPGESSRSRARE
jgi:RNA polymerase sigma-70 factor (ECF subfamily)